MSGFLEIVINSLLDMGDMLKGVGQIMPVWNTTRAAGLTSYLLLFISMVSGILLSFRFMKGARARNITHTLHNSTGWFGLLFGMVHGLVLSFDKYVGYSWGEILIPFTSHNKPLLTGIGTIALYMMFFLVASSDLIKQIGKKVWRGIHFLSFPAFLLAFLHGLLVGTDTQYSSIKLIYIVTGSIMAGLIVLRVMLVNKDTTQQVSVSKEVL